ncbi:MAG: hypothetical protein Q7S65_02895 [Nanoarchaeota archaeon]|nr:hypothetical protein [Nanoarchaeota archaeon]
MAKKLNPRPKQDDFFVSISDPSGVQVPLLESRRDLLNSMRLFAQLKDIRRQKSAYKAKLRKQVGEITRHIADIRSSIPDVTLEEEPSLPSSPRVAEVKQDRQPVTDLGKIEDGLKDIEARLAKLK